MKTKSFADLATLRDTLPKGSVVAAPAPAAACAEAALVAPPVVRAAPVQAPAQVEAGLEAMLRGAAVWAQKRAVEAALPETFRALERLMADVARRGLYGVRDEVLKRSPFPTPAGDTNGVAEVGLLSDLVESFVWLDRAGHLDLGFRYAAEAKSEAEKQASVTRGPVRHYSPGAYVVESSEDGWERRAPVERESVDAYSVKPVAPWSPTPGWTNTLGRAAWRW